ncbi:3-oxoacyl-ACP synthase [Flagellimonas iocasae]|uniref:3-oxoacyl-ACP synthase n=1 Tax=Flagellimonas iocasae TaxID=2055905 RepID=A0ABW4XYJ9_9FLAO
MGKKQELLQFCWDQVNAKSERLKQASDALQESLDSETKNSTGDKHETGRAMVQLEQEKLAQQHQELDRVKGILKKIDISKRSTTIGLGSTVSTSLANYFISVSCGTFTLEGKPFYCISMESPIAQLLVGKEAGESFVFNGATHSVLEVV